MRGNVVRARQVRKRDVFEGETVNWSDKGNEGKIKANLKILIRASGLVLCHEQREADWER